METQNQSLEENQKKPQANPEEQKATSSQNRRRLVIFIVSIVALLGLIIIAVYFLMQPVTPTEKIRDIFIIFMALESLVIGISLIILMVQLATLINLLQNEIKPILTSTTETVNTIRGTATFLSDNLAEPVIKLNEYLAGIKRLLEITRLIKR